MVFVVKYRKNLVSDEVFEYIKQICKGISDRYYIWFDALGCDGDHIHLVIEAAPKYSPSKIRAHDSTGDRGNRPREIYGVRGVNNDPKCVYHLSEEMIWEEFAF